MKEFVFGTAAQFDWLEALLADGRCHVFEHCVLPPGCTPGTSRLGFEKNGSIYILYIDYGIRTTAQDPAFCSLLQQGEARFVCMQDMIEFLQAMQPLFTTAPEEERAGLGFAVMESFMDKLQVKSAPEKGTTVTMRKKLGSLPCRVK